MNDSHKGGSDLRFTGNGNTRFNGLRSGMQGGRENGDRHSSSIASYFVALSKA